jgi:hypothetical protein
MVCFSLGATFAAVGLTLHFLTTFFFFFGGLPTLLPYVPVPFGIIASCDYHLVLSAQYAADILPLAMFLPCRALKDLRFAFIRADSPALGLPAVLAPCSPNLIVLILSPSFATTTWLFFGWLGVRFGLL